jgi:hypothetical protein
LGTNLRARFARGDLQPTVSEGVKTDETCQFENHCLQNFNASLIRPLLVGCPSGSGFGLLDLEPLWVAFEEGRNAADQSVINSSQHMAKPMAKPCVFKPTTFRGFQNVGDNRRRAESKVGILPTRALR